MREGENSSYHRDLRPGHVLKGVARELGRANQVPCKNYRKGVPVEQEPWRLKVCFRSETSPKGNTKTQEATRYRGRIAKSERTRNVLLAVLADHSTDGRKYRPGRWGSEPLATHCREGEAGYNVSPKHVKHGDVREILTCSVDFDKRDECHVNQE